MPTKCAGPGQDEKVHDHSLQATPTCRWKKWARSWTQKLGFGRGSIPDDDQADLAANFDLSHFRHGPRQVAARCTRDDGSERRRLMAQREIELGRRKCLRLTFECNYRVVFASYLNSSLNAEYCRERCDSVKCGPCFGLKPPHIRQLLYRLNQLHKLMLEAKDVHVPKTHFRITRVPLESKRLTNTPVRQAGSVLKCRDDRKNRVVSTQATYTSGCSAVGG